MDKILKVAIIGLDTSHSTAFAGFMLDPETKPEFKIDSMVPTRCLRFETPFQNAEGLNKRQVMLESLGVEVGTDFDWAVEGCDAIIMNINDPSYHVEYFEKCAKLGKPIYIDKPVAGTVAETRKIYELAEKYQVRFFSASSLRFDIDLEETLEAGNITAKSAVVWGPVGVAPAGSSIVWYGVHAFEMLERIMGIGAASVTVVNDAKGHVCTVEYADGRRGIVELTRKCPRYGALLRDDESGAVMIKSGGRVPFYVRLLKRIDSFFRGNDSAGVPLDESMEIMKLLEAADLSSQSGTTVYLKDL